jgi:hypothetical protein
MAPRLTDYQVQKKKEDSGKCPMHSTQFSYYYPVGRVKKETQHTGPATIMINSSQ